MFGHHAANRTPTAAYYTILESRTHRGWPRKNGFWFRSPYQKWVEKEEFEFSGLSGQISNFLTLFFKMCAKICQVATKREKIITIENVWVFSVWLQFDKKNGLLNILNPGQRREGTSSIIFMSGQNGHVIVIWMGLVAIWQKKVCKKFWDPGQRREGTSSTY